MSKARPKEKRRGGRRDDLRNDGRQTFNLSREELCTLLAQTRERCLAFQRKECAAWRLKPDQWRTSAYRMRC